ncbi:MAG: hypothetical protein M3Y35_02675 [Actinomycetota bacterium]|nr:hypothetical protein [Actinomycetota bacterium]
MSRRSWRAGKIQALRPVFPELGLPAAFVYEALEGGGSAQSSFELVADTGMVRSTVDERWRLWQPSTWWRSGPGDGQSYRARGW